VSEARANAQIQGALIIKLSVWIEHNAEKAVSNGAFCIVLNLDR
jgi:hypothetical protein